MKYAINNQSGVTKLFRTYDGDVEVKSGQKKTVDVIIPFTDQFIIDQGRKACIIEDKGESENDKARAKELGAKQSIYDREALLAEAKELGLKPAKTIENEELNRIVGEARAEKQAADDAEAARLAALGGGNGQ